jgi:hypothetical protein
MTDSHLISGVRQLIVDWSTPPRAHHTAAWPESRDRVIRSADAARRLLRSRPDDLRELRRRHRLPLRYTRRRGGSHDKEPADDRDPRKGDDRRDEPRIRTVRRPESVARPRGSAKQDKHDRCDPGRKERTARDGLRGTDPGHVARAIRVRVERRVKVSRGRFVAGLVLLLVLPLAMFVSALAVLSSSPPFGSRSRSSSWCGGARPARNRARCSSHCPVTRGSSFAWPNFRLSSPSTPTTGEIVSAEKCDRHYRVSGGPGGRVARRSRRSRPWL